MKRYVIICVEDSWASFYVTDNEELWKKAEEADNLPGGEGLMDWLFIDNVLDKFEHLQDLTGMEVLGLLQVAPY